MGYAQAGFEVFGVDIVNQPHYPFSMYIEDVLTWDDWDYDAIHISPPCQRWTQMNPTTNHLHPDLYTPMLSVLRETGLPYVIENVPTSPIRPNLVLCGTQFGLGTLDGKKELRRHRHFETNFRIASPVRPCNHVLPPVWAAGHNPNQQYVDRYGPCPIEERREGMGIDWMNRDEIAEAVPPAFTKHIGEQLLRLIERRG